MTLLFKQILGLSITASILIVAVVVLRIILKKAPKVVRYILWAMVGLRLLVPITVESPFSVMPSHKEVSAVSTGVSQAMNTTAVEVAQTTHSIGVFDILSYVWIFGAVIMLLYMLISFVRVRLMVRESVLYKDNVYLCDHVSSPFVLGILSPKIYLNSSISKKDSKLIIAHERTHIKHLDNLWKPLGFVLLSVYWFNPLCWLSYFLFVKDIELFCDESVVKTLSKNGKKNYSFALLSCSASKNMVTACPLAFAENSVKTRVKNILSYKKPALYVVVISVVLCVITMLMFMTSPVSAKEVEKKDVANATTTAETIKETAVETTVPTVAETEAETVAPTEKPVEKQTKPAVNNDYRYSDNGENYHNEPDWETNLSQGFDETQQQENPFPDIYSEDRTGVYWDDKNDSNINDVIYISELPQKNINSDLSGPSVVQ